MQYFVNDELVSKEDFFGKLEDAVNNYVEDNYDNLLDECYPEIKIGYCTFTPSQILEKCDPVAYRCGLSDEQSSQLEEYQDLFEDEALERIDGDWFETREEDSDDDEDEEDSEE